jgi:Peptidase family M23
MSNKRFSDLLIKDEKASDPKIKISKRKVTKSYDIVTSTSRSQVKQPVNTVMTDSNDTDSNIDTRSKDNSPAPLVTFLMTSLVIFNFVINTVAYQSIVLMYETNIVVEKYKLSHLQNKLQSFIIQIEEQFYSTGSLFDLEEKLDMDIHLTELLINFLEFIRLAWQGFMKILLPALVFYCLIFSPSAYGVSKNLDSSYVYHSHDIAYNYNITKRHSIKDMVENTAKDNLYAKTDIANYNTHRRPVKSMDVVAVKNTNTLSKATTADTFKQSIKIVDLNPVYSSTNTNTSYAKSSAVDTTQSEYDYDEKYVDTIISDADFSDIFSFPIKSDNHKYYLLNKQTNSVRSGYRFLVEPNSSIMAAGSGQVVYVGWENEEYYVKIDHGNGWSTIYNNLSHASVVPGQLVNQGEVIGSALTANNKKNQSLNFTVLKNSNI